MPPFLNAGISGWDGQANIYRACVVEGFLVTYQETQGQKSEAILLGDGARQGSDLTWSCPFWFLVTDY